jgi:tetratricopeptide (TPR) repeat protein
MIQIIFSIKFQSQLRRTRPAVFDSLEKTIVSSARLSGGNTRSAFRCIVADFDETAMGFWIDILSCIESVHKAVRMASNDLYGYICVINQFDDDDTIPFLLRAMPSDGKASGIWCSDTIRPALEHFAEFGQNKTEVELESDVERFTEIEAIKPLSADGGENALYAKVAGLLEQEPGKRTVLLGKPYIGKRESLRRYCENHGRNLPPLTVSFGSGGAGLSCLVNACTPALAAFFESKGIAAAEEMRGLAESLSKERLRDESSKYTLQKASRFFNLLLNAYCDAAAALDARPVLLLENIQAAKAQTWQIISEVYDAKTKQAPVLLYGSCSAETVPPLCTALFPYMINCRAEKFPRPKTPDMSPSLWETAYACKLFYQFFPPFSFIELLEEQGKNKSSIRRALELLFQNNMIRSIENPEPRLDLLSEKMEGLNPERRAYIRSLVKNTLLARVADGRITACYPLLEALHELGGGVSDELALEAVRADVINGTCASIEAALEKGSFTKVVGRERYSALYYCYKTLKCLRFANEKEIGETFRALKQEDSSISIYKSQMLTIEASYKMGIHETGAALDAIKESMVISQDSGKRPKIAHVYRLFSLVNLSKRELSDALDYLSFAIDDAEKTKDLDELAISAYYAGIAHFIYGNLSKAARLIRQSEQAARNAGRLEWALRAKFMQGRLYFEMGKYKDALAVFNAALENPMEEITPRFFSSVEAWIFRTELYLYECMPERPAALNADGRLFEIEAAYLNGEYRKTAELTEHFLNALPDEKFLFIEQPDWESGFSQCELIEFSKKEFWSRMCTVWRALALCRMKDAAHEEAILAMSKIMRDERFGDYDPNAPFYFFANYRVLNESSSAEVDRNTAISMAFKRLQRRAGRIDDIETRRSFLSNQYWNKILFSTAKDYKLI